MEKPFRLTFSNQLMAQAIRVDPSVELSNTLCEIGLHGPRPTLVLVGGASKMSGDNLVRLRSLSEGIRVNRKRDRSLPR